MPLDKQVVPLNIGAGLDTKNDPKKVIPGKLLTLENAIFRTPGAIRKRNGYEALSNRLSGSTTTISSAQGIETFQDQLLAFNQGDSYSYSQTDQSWSSKGLVSPFGFKSTSILKNAYNQTNINMCIHSAGYKFYTWQDSRDGGYRYSLLDTNTGDFLLTDVGFPVNQANSNAFAVGNYIVIFTVNTSTAAFNYYYIDVAHPTVVNGPVTFANDRTSPSNTEYDAVFYQGKLYLVYPEATGGVAYTYMNESLQVAPIQYSRLETNSKNVQVQIDEETDRVWFSYLFNNGGGLPYLFKYFNTDLNLNNRTVPGTLFASLPDPVLSTFHISNGFMTIFITTPQNDSTLDVTYKYTIDSSGTQTLVKNVRSVGIFSKIFMYNSKLYCILSYKSNLQPTYFVLDEDFNIIGKFASGIATKVYQNLITNVASYNNGKFCLSFPQQDSLTTTNGSITTTNGLQELEIDFNSKYNYFGGYLANNLTLTGGSVNVYDGYSFVESGFHLYPEALSQTNSAGNTLTAGTYFYVATYEWTDNQGQIQRSAPSPALQVVLTGSRSVDVTIPTLRLTAKRGIIPAENIDNKRTNASVVLYRTQRNGSIYFRVNAIGSLLNDPTADTVVCMDRTADSELVGNPTLYTTGGVVENIAPPCSDLICTYKNRLILVPTENKLSFWYSKQIVPGSPVEFSDIFVQNIDVRGGNITAIAPMDDKLIIFKETGIFYMVGQGPDPTGNNNDFSDAQLVTSDAGAISPFVAITPIGLMFKSKKGIYLLDRSLNAQYIGADVEQFNSANIVSATLIPYTNEIRFCLDNGYALMYDYFVKQWSSFTNHNAVDALIFQDVFAYLKSNGTVMQETPDSFTDAGEFIKLKLTTSWLSFAGLQAFQRVYKLMVLGTYISPHKLITKISYDFNPNNTQQTYVDAGTLLATPLYGETSPYGADPIYGGAYPTYEFEVSLERQKCTALQISLEDAAELPYGEGFSLSGLGLIVGSKRGLQKLPSTRKFG